MYENIKPYKCLIIISIVVFSINSGFYPIEFFQTSFNKKDGLGFTTLFLIFFTCAVSALFLPNLIHNWFDTKSILIISEVGWFLFVVSAYINTWYVMVPSAILNGAGICTLYYAVRSYVYDIAQVEAELKGKDRTKVFTSFYTMFYGTTQFSQVISNLIYANVLRINRSKNFTLPNDFMCGHQFCPENELPSSNVHVPQDKLNLLVSICVGFTLSSFFLLVFGLDRIGKSKCPQDRQPVSTVLSTIWKELKDSRTLCLAPIIIYSGLQIGFLTGDFTEAYVTCYIGIDMIGWIMMAYGMVGFLSPFVYSFMSRWVSSFVILMMITITQLSIYVLFLHWSLINTRSIWPYIVCAGLYGACNSAWRSELTIVFGNVYTSRNEKPNFTFIELFEGLGYCSAFLYGPFLCIRVKLYLTISFMIVGMVLYTWIEYKMRELNKKNVDIQPLLTSNEK